MKKTNKKKIEEIEETEDAMVFNINSTYGIRFYGDYKPKQIENILRFWQEVTTTEFLFMGQEESDEKHYTISEIIRI